MAPDRSPALDIASRRTLLKGAAALGAASALGFPAILRAAETLKLGVLQPLSGGLEVLGQQGVQGVQLAVEEANEAGGVLDGRMIELVIADSRTDPKTSVERTTELIQRDQVSAICGPVTSANRDAIQPTIERYQTPLLYATDYEGGVCSRYMTCYSALPEHWVEPFIPFLQQTYGSSYYLFGSDYIWPQKMNEAIRREVGEVGGEVVGEEYTPFGVKDFTSTVRKITGSGAEVVVITVVGADAITFVKQFVAAGGKANSTLAFFGYSENYLSGFSQEESEGILCPANFIATLDKPEAKAFVAKVKGRFGADAVVSNTVDAHYNLTRFFIEGIRRAGSDDKEAITEAMVDQTLMSGNGEVHLRPQDRHVDLNVLIAETTGAALVLKQDIGRVEAPSQCS
jgi:branched-chain amino acid transport system substrate-binding protein/urea transport system substrate-binding protein